MLQIEQRVQPAIAVGTPVSELDRVRPAYARATIGQVNLSKRDMPRAGSPVREVAPTRAAVGAAQPYGRPDAPAQPYGRPAAPAASPRAAVPAPRALPTPRLENPVPRGQKTPLELSGGTRLRICFGWNVTDARCDADASVFLLTAQGRVPSDDWFVFYGQRTSPDGSVTFAEDGRIDREVITVDLSRLEPSIVRLTFVLTIDEALERGLNFGMLNGAYLRVLDDRTGRELVSFRQQEYFENVTSMTLGELYLRNGQWRFNPVGNGVHKDLAGQCAEYGVQIG